MFEVNSGTVFTNLRREFHRLIRQWLTILTILTISIINRTRPTVTGATSTRYSSLVSLTTSRRARFTTFSAAARGSTLASSSTLDEAIRFSFRFLFFPLSFRFRRRKLYFMRNRKRKVLKCKKDGTILRSGMD